MSRRTNRAKAEAQAAPPAPKETQYVLEVVEGLEAYGASELKDVGAQATSTLSGEVHFSYDGDLQRLRRLLRAEAVYAYTHYAIPRPLALLGDQHFRALMRSIRAVLDTDPAAFRSFYIAAAGADSTVMRRLREAIAQHTGLQDRPLGDLQIRIRPAATGSGWETLVRITPRPLVTRAWRVANYEASLNATVASTMAVMLRVPSGAPVLNLVCGSGSLLVETALTLPKTHVYGVDFDEQVLALAAANIAASGAGERISLVQGDARRLPFAAGSWHHLIGDLPFGQHVGSHRENEQLYPALFAEAARIAAPDARLVCITHELRLMRQLLAGGQGIWALESSQQINLRGLHPIIYVLRRRVLPG
jgi:23S rRNA G2445 N2-methylase RlmL